MITYMNKFQIKVENETQKQHVLAVALAEKYRAGYPNLSECMRVCLGFDWLLFKDLERGREFTGANSEERDNFGKSFTYEEFCKMGLDGLFSHAQRFSSVDVAPDLKAHFNVDHKGFELHYKGVLICSNNQSLSILNKLVDKAN